MWFERGQDRGDAWFQFTTPERLDWAAQTMLPIHSTPLGTLQLPQKKLSTNARPASLYG